ncbi:T9SS type A sorting domain-containing protein [candidate division WOR-3 bacterium]|nr:T9SS type A sorting domain-containing protein [candidate division WOR-3 bacterium]
MITINTHDFPRGVYFVQLKTSKNSTISEKILIVN